MPCARHPVLKPVHLQRPPTLTILYMYCTEFVQYMIVRVGGHPAVMAQWHTTGGSSQRCPGVNSQRLPAFSCSSIFALSHLNPAWGEMLWASCYYILCDVTEFCTCMCTQLTLYWSVCINASYINLQICVHVWYISCSHRNKVWLVQWVVKFCQDYS